MPIFVTMPYSHEPEQPGERDNPPLDPMGSDEVSDGEGLTPERLRELIKRMESGFYDTQEVRDQIARRVRRDLDP